MLICINFVRPGLHHSISRMAEYFLLKFSGYFWMYLVPGNKPSNPISDSHAALTSSRSIPQCWFWSILWDLVYTIRSREWLNILFSNFQDTPRWSSWLVIRPQTGHLIAIFKCTKAEVNQICLKSTLTPNRDTLIVRLPQNGFGQDWPDLTVEITFWWLLVSLVSETAKKRCFPINWYTKRSQIDQMSSNPLQARLTLMSARS